MSLKFTAVMLPCSLALAACTAGAQDTPGQAQPPATPVSTGADVQASDVIDRYIEATGGRAAWTALRSIRGMGSIHMPGLPVEGRFTVEQTPTTYRLAVDMFQLTGETQQHVTRQVTVRNGHRTWRSQDGGPPQTLPPVAHADLLRKQTFNPLLEAKTRYASITLEGTELVEDAPCWKVALVPVDSEAPLELRWFDVAEGLQRKFAETPREGGLTAEVFLSDYRQVGMVKLHFKMRIVSVGASVERAFDAMQTNVTIDACLFEPPAEP